MWLLATWDNLQGWHAARSEFCGGLQVGEEKGERTLKAAAERTEGRTAAAGKPMSELWKTWSKLTTTCRWEHWLTFQWKKLAFFFFKLLCPGQSFIYNMFENGHMNIWALVDSTLGRVMPQSNATLWIMEYFHSSNYTLSK